MNTLAERVGIPCPKTRVLRVDDEAMLAVQRFDRHEKDGQRTRIHQEDVFSVGQQFKPQQVVKRWRLILV